MTELTAELVYGLLRPRAQESHKGTFGTLQLFCGSDRMTGAPYFAAKGALRTGVGLVIISATGALLRVLQTRLAEPVFYGRKISPRATAFVIGCGSAKSASFIEVLSAQTKPVVIDADAISYLAKKPHILINRKCDAVITPHSAEAARLFGCTAEQIESDREGSAAEMASRFKAVIVLKGHRTVIALPDGRTYINTTGNSGLAQGGSGVVLAGMIGSYLAQGYNATDAALLSVFIHGAAADRLAATVAEDGILPSDITEALPYVIRELRQKQI